MKKPLRSIILFTIFTIERIVIVLIKGILLNIVYFCNAMAKLWRLWIGFFGMFHLSEIFTQYFIN